MVPNSTDQKTGLDFMVAFVPSEHPQEEKEMKLENEWYWDVAGDVETLLLRYSVPINDAWSEEAKALYDEVHWEESVRAYMENICEEQARVGSVKPKEDE